MFFYNAWASNYLPFESIFLIKLLMCLKINNYLNVFLLRRRSRNTSEELFRYIKKETVQKEHWRCIHDIPQYRSEEAGVLWHDHGRGRMDREFLSFVCFSKTFYRLMHCSLSMIPILKMLQNNGLPYIFF